MKIACIVSAIEDDKISLQDLRGFSIQLKADKFDTMMFKVGSAMDIEVSIPYGVSAKRRADIRDHREEEARNGDI